MRSIVTFLFISLVHICNASTITRVTPGPWSDSAGWFIGGVPCGCIPGPGDDVVVSSGGLFYLDINTTVRSVHVTSSVLRVDAGYNLNITAPDAPLLVTSTLINQGMINIGTVTSGSPSVHIVGTLDNQSTISIGVNNAGIALLVPGSLINSGSITTQATGLEGMLITPTGSVTNTNNLTFLGPNATNGIDVNGLFNNSGSVVIHNATNDGLSLFGSGSLTHSGIIDIKMAGRYGMEVNANYINSGTIDINQTGDHGILILPTTSFDNLGSVVIHGPTSKDGIRSIGTFTNNGIIDVKKTDESGIVCTSGSMTNNGTITIGGDVKKVGLGVLSSFTNTADIEVQQSDNAKVQVYTGATLLNSGDINLTGSTSFAFRTFGLVENFGNILVSNSPFPLAITSTGTVLNHGQIAVDASNPGNVNNQGTYHNIDCGTFLTDRIITNGGTIENNGFILSKTNFDHGGSGTFVNNGIIKESGAKGFRNFTFTSNDGYLILPVSGLHCHDNVITAVFDGTGLSANYTAPISSTPAHSDVVATYDVSANELTLLPASFGLNELYIQFVQGSCTKSIALDFEDKIGRLWYEDNDGDGYGNSMSVLCDTVQPIGYLLDDSDCADYDPKIYPGAPERCNGIDDDCDGNPESLSNVWTGLGDGISWSDGANWTEGYAPIECQQVIIDLPSTIVRHNAGDSAKIKKLFIALPTITLEIEPGAEIVVENDGVTSHGKIINDGSFKILNSIGSALEILNEVNNNGTLLVEGAGNYGIWVHTNNRLINNGVVDINGNIGLAAIFNEGDLTNQVNGDIHIYNIPSTASGIKMSSGALLASLMNEGIVLIEAGEYGIVHQDHASYLHNMPQGSLTIQNIGKSAIVKGYFDNEGFLLVDNITETALLEVDNSQNSGKLVISNVDSTAMDVIGSFVNLDSIIIHDVIHGIDISGTEYDNQGVTEITTAIGHGVLTNSSSVYLNQGRTSIELTGQDAFHMDGELHNGGSILIDGAGGKGIDAGTILENGISGTIIIKNTGAQGTDFNTCTFLNEGKLIYNSIATDALDLDNASGAVNMGTITFQHGTTGMAISGTSTLLNAATGVIEGQGRIAGPKLDNRGLLSPGPPTATFEFVGMYDHVNGAFDIDLDGYNGSGLPGGYDAIASTDPVLLGGVLTVKLGTGFEPVPGDNFVVVNAGARVNTFATINLPTGYCMVAEYTPNRVNITMPGLPTGTWSGTVSSDWFNPLNWVEGCVPGPETDVNIVVSTSMPEVGHGKIARVKSIAVDPFAILTVIDGSELRVLGN